MDNKKIIFQVTRAYMRKNRKRTLITFLGMLLMVSLMTMVFVGKDTVMLFLQKAVESQTGSWRYQLFDIDKEQADQIKELKCVNGFAFSKALGYTNFDASGNPQVTPYLELTEYSGELFDWMNIKVKEGRLPENPDEVIISERAIKEGADIKIGDTVETDCFERYIHSYGDDERNGVSEEEKEKITAKFPMGFQIDPGETVKTPDHFPYFEDNDVIEMIHEPTGFNKSLTVVGIMESPAYELKGQGGYIALTGSDGVVNENERVTVFLTEHSYWQEYFREKYENDYWGIFVETAKIQYNSKTPEEKEALLNKGGGIYYGGGELIPHDEEDEAENIGPMRLEHYSNNGAIIFQVFFVVMIVVATAVFIYNVLGMSYRERCRYLGVLSSVGATRGQKKWSVYYEVFLLLGMALPVGIGIGILLIKGAMKLLYPYLLKALGVMLMDPIALSDFEVACSLVVNYMNIMLVVICSIAAVWIAVLRPAHMISKVGAFENIKGNELSIKLKKGYKTYPGLMLKGKAERLIGTASVERNRTSTRGIVRSITVFITLTLVVAFVAGSISDVFFGKISEAPLFLENIYKNYAYVLENDSGHSHGDLYESGVEAIKNSEEVSGYREIEAHHYVSSYSFGAFHSSSFYGEIDDCIPLEYFNEEYFDVSKKALEKWYPNATPEEIKEMISGEGDFWYDYDNSALSIIIINDEDFNNLADKAGVDLAKYEDSKIGPALVYDTYTIGPEKIHRSGIDNNSFKRVIERINNQYVLKRPLTVNEGETIELTLPEYYIGDGEHYRSNLPLTFAGYVNDNDLQGYFNLNGKRLCFIVSQQTRDNIKLLSAGWLDSGYIDRKIYFNLNTDDSDLLRNLSQIKQDGRSFVRSTEVFDRKDYYGMIMKVVNIIAIWFAIMIACICLLNLYNSVMERCRARKKELAVLYSMGMTDKQKNKMFLIENIWILVTAFIYSALITLMFVICLYKWILYRMFLLVRITFPVWVVIMLPLVSIIGLMLLTKICYRHDRRKQIIEEIRMESI